MALTGHRRTESLVLKMQQVLHAVYAFSLLCTTPSYGAGKFNLSAAPSVLLGDVSCLHIKNETRLMFQMPVKQTYVLLGL